MIYLHKAVASNCIEVAIRYALPVHTEICGIDRPMVMQELKVER